MNVTELTEGQLIQTERRPSGWGTRQVLYFRADKVVALLQSHVDHLNEISVKLKEVVEKHKAHKTLLDDAYAELHKLWGGHHVVFDREVYNRVNAWWDAKEKEG